MRKDYASRLTREDLEKGGITCITEDGLVFKGDKQVKLNIHSNGYIMLSIYELDEEGNKIKVPIQRRWTKDGKLYNSYNYKAITIGLHRAMWAWFYGEVPAGYVVDHISNQHKSIEDYHLSNLQLLTPGENLAKERIRKIDKTNELRKMSFDKARAFKETYGEETYKEVYWFNLKCKEKYESQLESSTQAYVEAKKNHNAKEAHRLRSRIAYLRKQLLRYIGY